jgi:hypothetical protein
MSPPSVATAIKDPCVHWVIGKRDYEAASISRDLQRGNLATVPLE